MCTVYSFVYTLHVIMSQAFTWVARNIYLTIVIFNYNWFYFKIVH